MASFDEIGGFDANKVEPVTRSVLPHGDYDAMIVASEWKPTKNQDGKYLELKIQVLSGPYQNRMLWDRLNIQNKNAQAVQIAKGTLSAICRAVGVMNPNRSEELHQRPMKVTVKVKDDGQHGQSNEVTAYKSRHVGGGAPAPSSPDVAPPSGAQVASQGNTATPW
jgi:hypothetical protein